MFVVKAGLLVIQLLVQLCILPSSVFENLFLLVDLLSEGAYHACVCIDSTLEVILNATFLISDSVEVLLQTE